MTMKRSREDREVEALAMANCLMLLSRVGETASSSGRVFECKTCNRQFSSFQALGGHRASHKRPKVMAGELVIDQPAGSPAKPKTHECTICGLEFPIGQALGGHMRRHRPVNVNNHSTEAAAAAVVDIMKSSSKRVFSLDLNLTPYENHLKSKFGKMLTV